MESNDKLEEIGVKNGMSYYFDDMIKTEDFDFDNRWKNIWKNTFRTKV